MTDEFDTAKQRVTYAHKAIGELDPLIDDFLQTDPITNVIDVDENAGTETHKFKLTRELPQKLSLRVQQIIENLRFALDSAACAAAIVRGAESPRSAYFPFGRTAADLEIVIKGRCKDVPEDICAVFRSFEPHAGAHTMLYALNVASNTRHGLLRAVGIVSREHFVRTGNVEKSFRAFQSGWDAEKGEIEIAVIVPGSKIEYDIDMPIEIVFGEVEFVEGRKIHQTLLHWCYIVSLIVLSTEVAAKNL